MAWGSRTAALLPTLRAHRGKCSPPRRLQARSPCSWRPADKPLPAFDRRCFRAVPLRSSIQNVKKTLHYVNHSIHSTTPSLRWLRRSSGEWRLRLRRLAGPAPRGVDPKHGPVFLYRCSLGSLACCRKALEHVRPLQSSNMGEATECAAEPRETRRPDCSHQQPADKTPTAFDRRCIRDSRGVRAGALVKRFTFVPCSLKWTGAACANHAN